jgi:hypothetical protein
VETVVKPPARALAEDGTAIQVSQLILHSVVQESWKSGYLWEIS